MTVSVFKGFPHSRNGIVGDPGLFGPGSAAWHVNGEMVLAFGGARALLLQLAHPSVAAGVADHSEFSGDPFARLWRTLDAMLTISFGDRSQAEEAADRVTARHRMVNGVTAAGNPYDALDPALLLWVHATLVDSAMLSYERLVGPLGPAARERYYEEMKRQAIMLLVPENVLPPSLQEFGEYFEKMVSELEVSDDAKRLAMQVLEPNAPLYYKPISVLLKNSTIAMLPERIREELDLHFTPGRERAFEVSSWILRRLVSVLPKRLRLWPQAREALRRTKRPPAIPA